MTRNPEPLKTIGLVVFLGFGLFLVQMGVLPLWAWGLLSVAVIGMRVIAGMDRYADHLSVTDAGVLRTHGSRMRQRMEESVTWDEIVRVEALSHEAGPEKKDVLLLLYGSGDRGVAVSATLAQQHDLLGQLRRRLPGFSDDQLTQAMAAGERRSFVLWERP